MNGPREYGGKMHVKKNKTVKYEAKQVEKDSKDNKG
jgi:hypothetical protein